MTETHIPHHHQEMFFITINCWDQHVRQKVSSSDMIINPWKRHAIGYRTYLISVQTSPSHDQVFPYVFNQPMFNIVIISPSSPAADVAVHVHLTIYMHRTAHTAYAAQLPQQMRCSCKQNTTHCKRREIVFRKRLAAYLACNKGYIHFLFLLKVQSFKWFPPNWRNL